MKKLLTLLLIFMSVNSFAQINKTRDEVISVHGNPTEFYNISNNIEFMKWRYSDNYIKCYLKDGVVYYSESTNEDYMWQVSRIVDEEALKDEITILYESKVDLIFNIGDVIVRLGTDPIVTIVIDTKVFPNNDLTVAYDKAVSTD